MNGKSAAERDPDDAAEGTTGHEGSGERGSAVGGEDGEDDGQADAAVRGLPDADEQAGEEQLVVTNREGGRRGGDAPDDRHEDDRADPAPPVGQQRQRHSEDADGEGDHARQRTELGVAERPFGLEEGEDRREHLPGHVVRQQETEGQEEDDPGVDPASADRGGVVDHAWRYHSGHVEAPLRRADADSRQG